MKRRPGVALAMAAAVLGAGCAPSRDVGPTQTAVTRRPTPTAPTTTLPVAPTTTDPPAPGPTAPPPAPTTTGPPTTTVPPPATVGRYPVVTSTVTVVDPSRPTVSRGTTVATSRTLPTLVYRPAVAGKWPLVVFAHGFQVGPAPYATLLDAWASAGYVVAAPAFPLTDQAIAGANLDENDIQNQPGDVRVVLDTLVGAGSPVAADIDAARVLYAGHSDGAETVLAASLTPAPAGEPAPRAVVCMSVSPLNGVTSTANPPLLVTQGDSDTINPSSLGMQTYAEAAGPKYYLDVLGGEHLPPLEAGSRWLPAIEAATLAFFHLYAYGGDPAAVVAAGTDPGSTTIRSG